MWAQFSQHSFEAGTASRQRATGVGVGVRWTFAASPCSGALLLLSVKRERQRSRRSLLRRCWAWDDFDVWCGEAHALDTPEAEAEDATVESALAPVAADANLAVRMVDRLLAFRVVCGDGLRRHQ